MPLVAFVYQKRGGAIISSNNQGCPHKWSLDTLLHTISSSTSNHKPYIPGWCPMLSAPVSLSKGHLTLLLFHLQRRSCATISGMGHREGLQRRCAHQRREEDEPPKLGSNWEIFKIYELTFFWGGLGFGMVFQALNFEVEASFVCFFVPIVTWEIQKRC